MGPRVLIFETSGRAGFVAVAVDDEMRSVRRLDETRRHARDLAPAVSELLAGQRWQPRDIDVVFVSRGPGSYTGLRVGLMSAKAFAYATRCALLAIDTFAAIAVQAPADAELLDVIADAQQNKLYVQRFAKTTAASSLLPQSPLNIQDIEEWRSSINPTAVVSGPGIASLKETALHRVRTVPPELLNPLPESLLRIGLKRFRLGERDDCFAVDPLYLRPSSAEEKWRPRPTS